MLQVDENIGGRQDQKNNGLRTKTLAVGLLMMVGCFIVGFFSATTTTTTTTAHTRVSSPNGNSCQIYKQIPSQTSFQFNSVPTISLSINSCLSYFFKLRQSRWHGLQFTKSRSHKTFDSSGNKLGSVLSRSSIKIKSFPKPSYLLKSTIFFGDDAVADNRMLFGAVVVVVVVRVVQPNVVVVVVNEEQHKTKDRIVVVTIDC